MKAENVHVGPSDYVPWLSDRKWCYIRMEGTTFGNVPLNCEVKLEVWDSPNSAGVVIDAIRCAKVALDRGMGGALTGPSSYFMKSPPVQYTDDEAMKEVEAFISGESPECTPAKWSGGRKRGEKRAYEDRHLRAFDHFLVGQWACHALAGSLPGVDRSRARHRFLRAGRSLLCGPP